jgi:hypothetical protein
LQAGIYGSAKILARLCGITERPIRKWQKAADKFADKLTEMWQENWFCDFDTRSNQWITPNEYFDITNLSPLLFNVGSKKQIEKLKARIIWFLENPAYWLEWPSFFFMYIELLWHAGQNRIMSHAIYETVERVYAMWDRREWDKSTSMPGISIECWGLKNPIGAEGYGWAATLPLHIIRGVIGFRETWDIEGGFMLTPSVPFQFLQREGDSYSIKNLNYRDLVFEITYMIKNGGKLLCHILTESPSVRSIAIEKLPITNTSVNAKREKGKCQVEFETVNFERYVVKVERA